MFCAEYYANRSLAGNPAFTRNDSPPLNFAWGSGGPGNGLGVNDFSVRWQGSFSLITATYTSTATADDGLRGPDCRSAYGIVHHTERPLWHLFELDNWDKHRSLNLIEHLGLYTLVLPPEWDIYTSGNAFALGGGFKRGAPVARLSLGPGRDPKMKVYLRTTYDVAFDGFGPQSVAAEPVLQTLDNIRLEIRRRVLPSLREFLPA